MNQLLLGNTLEVLKTITDESIDCGVTSPPYNKGVKNKGWLVDKVDYDVFSDNMPENLYQQNQIYVLNELYRIIKPGGSFFYNHKLRWDKGYMIHPMDWLRKTKWCIRQEITWNRKIASNIRGWRFWQIDEKIYWLYKPLNNNLIGEEMKSNHSLLTSIWELSPEKNNPHPAPFPITIPTRCLYSILDKDENKTIIDPYCGSGTTMVSAKLLGHNYIGIDISQQYLDMTKDRLTNIPQEDIDNFEKEVSLHKVVKTFKQRKEEGLWKKKN